MKNGKGSVCIEKCWFIKKDVNWWGNGLRGSGCEIWKKNVRINGLDNKYVCRDVKIWRC
jgi:hypothetical protein